MQVYLPTSSVLFASFDALPQGKQLLPLLMLTYASRLEAPDHWLSTDPLHSLEQLPCTRLSSPSALALLLCVHTDDTQSTTSATIALFAATFALQPPESPFLQPARCAFGSVVESLESVLKSSRWMWAYLQ